MKYVGYYNGEIGPLEEMKIPMLDRTLHGREHDQGQGSGR